MQATATGRRDISPTERLSQKPSPSRERELNHFCDNLTGMGAWRWYKQGQKTDKWIVTKALHLVNKK